VRDGLWQKLLLVNKTRSATRPKIRLVTLITALRTALPFPAQNSALRTPLHCALSCPAQCPDLPAALPSAMSCLAHGSTVRREGPSYLSQYSVLLRTGRPVFVPRQRQRIFSSNLCVQTSSGAHPASYTIGTGGSFPGRKAPPGCGADHSPPSSAKVKKE
jgi:hypothetical protein